ncbi:MAG TPA: hypothetical protein VMR99_00715 [Candidatus Paceibacterota bacterium]|nr:hypothetical protein [Candidatus Paceibacterota bacterium]
MRKKPSAQAARGGPNIKNISLILFLRYNEQDMSGNGMNGTRRYLRYAIIILAILLIILGILLVREYLTLRREQIINARELQLSAILKSHGPLTADDVAVIQPWMTFSYINTLFKISPDYLKTNLSISDLSYPQLSLSEYANYENVDVITVMNQVEDSLYNYLTATSTQ